MCGFAGLFQPNGAKMRRDLRGTALRMVNTLHHRGPDDDGHWADNEAGIAFGFRRLSIVDLSPAGHQPMVSRSGRYVLVFNGEIYNAEDLRDELGHKDVLQFRGHSDTEVMLACFDAWDVTPSVARFNGMFAFVVWDRREHLLYLFRDRLGEKPLYYCWMGATLIFGSELKALRAHPEFQPEIDRDALTLLLRHNCIPAPYSIYKSVQKLPAASFLCVSATSGLNVNPVPYWSMKEVVDAGLRAPLLLGERETVEQLDSVLRKSVKMRMLGDVPIGAFLSGGIDSSMVVALMQAQSSRSVRTFSIGFEESGYNEAAEAKSVASYLRTDHTELYVTAAEAVAVIPRLPYLYDEPFADSSQIPTFLVAQLARQSVTVCLSGDGGDEVFGGYNRYSWISRIWKTIGWMPESLRKAASSAITSISSDRWERALSSLGPALPSGLKQRMPGDRVHKLACIMGASSPQMMYKMLCSHWLKPERIVVNSNEPKTRLTEANQSSDLTDLTAQMMYLDTITYLTDDILTKLDRATMAVSLEARVPLLDHELVEFAWRIPLSLKICGGQGKHILRQVLYRYIPRKVVERPKMGFGIPLGSWLRGALRDWAESLLDATRLKNEGYFSPEPIREKWKEHLSGTRNWQHHLWDILMFQAWLEETKRYNGAAPERLARA
jgi:asparagine synthase (glutamine-hydrolysing)